MKSLPLKCAAVVLLLSVTALGQVQINEAVLGRPSLEFYDFDFSGSGARAQGMGRAFVGLSDDVTSGSWNPAGLYNLDQPIISLSYGSTLPRGSTENNPMITGSSTSLRFDHNGSIDGVTGINFVAPLRVKGQPFVGSFAYNRGFDEYEVELYSDQFTAIYSPNGAILDTTEFNSETISEMQGTMNSVNFGLATRIYETYSAGVTVNVYTGSVTRNSVTATRSDSILDANLQTRNQLTTNTILDSNSFSGYNFTLGFKRSSEKLDLGLMIRTPFDLEIETDRGVFFVTQQNGQTIDAGTDTVFFDDMIAKYEMPWMIGLGAALKPNERLTLAADLEYRAFDGRTVLIRDSVFLDPGGQNEEFFTELPADSLWDNVLQLRLGVEYLWNQSFATIPLRAGFGYTPSLVPSTNLVVSSSDTTFTTEGTNGIMFSLGAGMWWNQIHFDIAYSYQNRDWDYAFLQGGDPRAIEQSSRNHFLNATFTGYF